MDVWEEEGITLLSDEDMEKKYSTTNIEGAIISTIKHVRRYGEQTLPKELLLKILFYALKGLHCKDNHWDSAQKISLYEYFKDKKIDNPYIQQFVKEVEKDV
jgi:hypothetical protein